jgi:hypothetical protein
MTVDLEEIFEADRAPLATIRSRIAEWASSLLSEEKEISDFYDFVAKNMRAKTWGHSPRKAFLIFSIASEDSCKATVSVKNGCWESYFTFLIKVISKGKAIAGDTAAPILEEDTEECLKVRIFGVVKIYSFLLVLICRK